MKGWPLLLLVLLSALNSSCESTSDASFTPQIVVQGILYANEPVDSIVIRQTLPLDAAHPSDRVSGAKVTLTVGDSSYELVEDIHTPIRGRYVSVRPLIVVPGATYSLRVEALGQIATASTTVPQAIHLDSVKLADRTLSLTSVDSVVYPTSTHQLTNPGIHLWWSPSPGSAGYGVEAVSLDSTADLIVIDLGQRLPDSTSLGRYRFLILSTDEQVVWLQFRRFGLNAVRALALDKNYQDYILSLYLSGSQFNNNTLHVNGGLGVFGSAARTLKKVYLE